MAACPAFDAMGPWVSSVVAYVDCQSLALGEAGYRALGAGSPFGMALTGLLTIYVALVGYRLLLGGELTVRYSVATALKLGIVLALATQWSAYRVLVFDVVTKMPEASALSIAGPLGIASAGARGIAGRVDRTSEAAARLVESRAGSQAAQQAKQGQPQQQGAAAAALPGNNAIEWGAGVLSVTALAGLLSVRVVLGLLLALGPGFIACLLFDITRSLFTGWIKVLAGTFLAALAVPVVLDLELAVVERQVLALIEASNANQPLGPLPVQMLGSTVFFALVLLAVLVLLARAGLAFRLPADFLRDGWRTTAPQPAASPSGPGWAMAGANATGEEPSRARRVALAAQALDWREARMIETSQTLPRHALPHDEGGTSPTGYGERLPLGQEGRRAAHRQSRAASHRDDMT